MSSLHLLRLLQLTDPTLPVGGFAHSAGLETYVQKGIVKDRQTGREFIVAQLSQNIHYTDAAFVSLTYEAARKEDWNMIRELDAECTAVKLPKEIREASQKLGNRLVKIFEPVCQSQTGYRYKQAISTKECMGHYSIAFGIYSAALEITKDDALTGFYYNAAAGLVTNCVKLIPLGQQAGQELLFSLQPMIRELVQKSLEPDRELLGLCCTGFDIRSMQHEELYSRLYMS
jgi:urease accessory protein